MDGQCKVAVQFARQALDHVVHAKWRGHPACNVLAALGQSVHGSVSGIQRQVHDQGAAGIAFAAAQRARQRQRPGVARAQQRLAPRRLQHGILSQFLLVFRRLGCDVRDQRLPRARPGGFRHARQQRHPLQARARLWQVQGLHVGLEFLLVDAVGAFVVALGTTQHHFVRGDAVRQVGNHAVHGQGESLQPALVPCALHTLPDQIGDGEQQQ